ncbi:MAG: YggS family pyridoxal phosphate-dependent enzyme [Candidatus Margulisiibacteriota bacterium]
MSIKENLQTIRSQIAKAAASIGRDPNEITIIGAVKNQPTEKIIEALEAGLTDIGENKVQEAKVRYEEIKSKFPNVTWHMIGHLQRNKVRQALDVFDIIHSLDSERLAREISEKGRGAGDGGRISVLVEVNTSGEETKYGIPADSTIDFLKKLSKFGNIKVQGLMTIAPLIDDPEKVRPYFKKLKDLSENIKKLNLPNIEMKYLSMGMTDDFSVAIQEGSNMVRIGRAIFGPRPPKL